MVYEWQLPFELRALVGMVAISGSDTLLDVGIGTGAVLRELERPAVLPARAIGVDISKPIPARARAALSPGTELLAADARALPLADASDVATCAYLLHCADDRSRRRPAGAPPGAGARWPPRVVTLAPPKRGLAKLMSAPVRAAGERSTGLLAGLRPLDPRGELRAGGFEASSTRHVSIGYPSLYLVARHR